jgi:hypothetical protein
MSSTATAAPLPTAVALDPGFGGSISGMMFSSGGLFGGSTHSSRAKASVSYRRGSGGAGGVGGNGVAPLAGPGIAPTLPPLPEDGPSPLDNQPPPAGPYRETGAARSARSLQRSLSRLSTTSSVSSWIPGPPPRRPASRSSSLPSPGVGSGGDLPITLAPLLLDDGDAPRPSTAGSVYSAPGGDRRLSGSVYSPVAPYAASSTSLPYAPSSASLSEPGGRRLPELASVLPGPAARLGLPPPFTLEPAPRWDRAAHDPFAPSRRRRRPHAALEDGGGNGGGSSEASNSPPHVEDLGPSSLSLAPPPSAAAPLRDPTSQQQRSPSPLSPPGSPMEEDASGDGFALSHNHSPDDPWRRTSPP